jgi:hypothetical protein
MMKYALPGLTLLTVSMFSGYVSAAPAVVGSCDATVLQMLKDQAKDNTSLNTRLSLLLDQQGYTNKQLTELQKQQEQTGKQIANISKADAPQPKNSKQGVLVSPKDNSKFCVPAEPGKTTADGKMILGETEWIYIEEANGNFMTRVDTGATTSSISAEDIEVFEREGHRWVKFTIPVDGGDKVHVEAPFVKYIRIRQANGLEDRPIVQMTVRMGSVTEKADFSLTDRSKMDFPVLLGREFIKDIAVVDVARENVQGKPQIAGAVQASEQNKQAEGTEDKSDKQQAKKEVKKETKAKAADKKAVKSATNKDGEQPDFQPVSAPAQNQKKEVKTALPVNATQPAKATDEEEEGSPTSQPAATKKVTTPAASDATQSNQTNK